MTEDSRGTGRRLGQEGCQVPPELHPGREGSGVRTQPPAEVVRVLGQNAHRCRRDVQPVPGIGRGVRRPLPQHGPWLDDDHLETCWRAAKQLCRDQCPGRATARDRDDDGADHVPRPLRPGTPRPRRAGGSLTPPGCAGTATGNASAPRLPERAVHRSREGAVRDHGDGAQTANAGPRCRRRMWAGARARIIPPCCSRSTSGTRTSRRPRRWAGRSWPPAAQAPIAAPRRTSWSCCSRPAGPRRARLDDVAAIVAGLRRAGRRPLTVEDVAERRGIPLLVAAAGTDPDRDPRRPAGRRRAGPARERARRATAVRHAGGRRRLRDGDDARRVGPDGAFIGGAIAPASSSGSRRWPRGRPSCRASSCALPDRAIGRDTVSAIQAGTVFGYQALVDGPPGPHPPRACGRGRRRAPTRSARPHGRARGGAVGARRSKASTRIDPDLTLRGLAILQPRSPAASRCEPDGRDRAARRAAYRPRGPRVDRGLQGRGAAAPPAAEGADVVGDAHARPPRRSWGP